VKLSARHPGAHGGAADRNHADYCGDEHHRRCQRKQWRRYRRQGLTVLHCDKDFDLIASVTGQPAEWLIAG
jgi:hypothetical protein